MKHRLFFSLCFIPFLLIAQTPEGFNYQAVIRNNNGTIKSNEQIQLTINLRQNSPDGTIVCAETYNIKTNSQGLVNLQIGTVNETDFENIDWSTGSYFLEVIIDGKEIGTSKILSVPYAIHAKNATTALNYEESDPEFNAWDKSTGIIIQEAQITDLPTFVETETDPIFNSSTASTITKQDINQWNTALTSYTESDPVFLNWNKSEGIQITESQISDLGNYLENETDPQFSNSMAATISEEDISNWNNKPDSFLETDPSFNSWDKSSDISISESQINDLKPYLINELDPDFNNSVASNITANDVSDWNNKLDSFTESDPLFTVWDKSTGITIKENQVSDLKDYLESETDPVYKGSPVSNITSDDILTWKTMASLWTFENDIISSEYNVHFAGNAAVSELSVSGPIKLGLDNDSNSDQILFNAASNKQCIEWNKDLNTFYVSNSLVLKNASTFSNNNRCYAFNNFSTNQVINPLSGEMNAAGDMYIEEDLEVGNSIYANNLTTNENNTSQLVIERSSDTALIVENIATMEKLTGINVLTSSTSTGGSTGINIHTTGAELGSIGLNCKTYGSNSYNYAGKFQCFGDYGVFGLYAKATSQQDGYGIYATATSDNPEIAFSVYCAGNGVYTGSWSKSSDEKLKSNIADIQNGLHLVKQIKPRTFDYRVNEFKDMNLSTGKQFGFIAQEIETIIPEVVNKAKQPIFKDGELTDEFMEFKTVNYTSLIPILTKAIQEQQQIIESQSREIEQIQQQLLKLTETVDSLK